MPPPLRIRPYKDFLTPALHRKFVRAAAVLFGICYVEAILLGEWDSLLWSWFPFGRTGIRTGLLFVCGFSIFVLRVAQLHVGHRTTTSGFETFKKYAFTGQTVQTAGWYLFSAWLYSEIYIFSSSKDANIKWITQARHGDRPRLNERPIFLMSYLIMLALLQTGCHLYFDYDRVDMPVTKTKPTAASDQIAHLVVPPNTQIKSALPVLITNAAKRSFLMLLAAPFIYSLFIRDLAWGWTLSFAKVCWSLPKSTALPAVRPYHIPFMFKCLKAGFPLLMLWEVGNCAFSAYVAQEPLKNDRPITYESRDPNGSLLTGLRGKKLQTRAFAFWELVFVAQTLQGRRKTIYEEIDRKGGSTWSQILEVCLNTINEANLRIANYLSPALAPAPAAKEQDIPGLPRLAAPIKQDNIFSSSPPPKTRAESAAFTVGSIAKAHGQSPTQSPAQKLIKQATSAMPAEGKEMLTPQGIWKVLGPYATQVLESPVGWPFRQEYRRRIASVILGSPFGDVGIFVDAIDVITRLAVYSLKEDSYGNVQRDVPTIIRTFTSTINRIEAFKKSIGVHWTDVEKKQESPEAETILAALRGGLQELIDAFGDYADDLRLSQRDMREAREAATPVPKEVEMKEKKSR